MTVAENVLYGLLSGIAEFLPISSKAHQSLMHYLFGTQTRDAFQDLLIHIGILLAILISTREVLFRLYRDQKMLFSTKRRKGRTMRSRSFYDLRLLKTATFPLLISLCLCLVTAKLEGNLLAIMSFLIINAIVLLFAEHSRHGNRDSRTMSGLDGIVLGIVGSLSVFPGISRTGMTLSYSIIRGADKQSAFNWSILLGIPAVIFALCFDTFGVIGQGIPPVSFPVIAGYILSGLTAFCGGYIGISSLQLFLNRSGVAGFAYYSIGTALFSFILYLIT